MNEQSQIGDGPYTCTKTSNMVNVITVSRCAEAGLANTDLAYIAFVVWTIRSMDNIHYVPYTYEL